MSLREPIVEKLFFAFKNRKQDKKNEAEEFFRQNTCLVAKYA